MKNILLKASLVLLISGCVQSAKSVSEKNDSVRVVVKTDDKLSVLNWIGIYEGVLPCADCEGIKTEITLNSDSSFFKKTVYLSKDSTVFEENGIVKWAADHKIISLDDSKYVIGPNSLSQLDADGSRVLGALSEHYILKKVIY